jgi:hypothetical protein
MEEKEGNKQHNDLIIFFNHVINNQGMVDRVRAHVYTMNIDSCSILVPNFLKFAMGVKEPVMMLHNAVMMYCVIMMYYHKKFDLKNSTEYPLVRLAGDLYNQAMEHDNISVEKLVYANESFLWCMLNIESMKMEEVEAKNMIISSFNPPAEFFTQFQVKTEHLPHQEQLNAFNQSRKTIEASSCNDVVQQQQQVKRRRTMTIVDLE